MKPVTDPLEAIRKAMEPLIRTACIACGRSLPTDRVFTGTCSVTCEAYVEGVQDGVRAGEWKATLERVGRLR